jgi:hypothetical protein
MFTYDYGIITLNGVTWKVIPDPSVEQIILKDTKSDKLFQFGKENFSHLVKRFSRDILSLVWLFNTYFWGNQILARIVDLFSNKTGARLTSHHHSSDKINALAQLMVEQSLNHHASYEYAEMFENLGVKLERDF